MTKITDRHIKRVETVASQYTQFCDAMRELGVIGQQEFMLALFFGACMGEPVMGEGPPGTAKTFAVTRATTLFGGATCSRIQSTADLQPSDVTGQTVYMPAGAEAAYAEAKANGTAVNLSEAYILNPGPVFSRIVLDDDASRKSPRTWSGAIEAMEEKQVTILGVTYALDPNLSYIMTVNPEEHEGVEPLPDAIRDRVAMSVALSYVNDSDFLGIVDIPFGETEIPTVDFTLTEADLENVRQTVWAVANYSYADNAAQKEAINAEYLRIRAITRNKSVFARMMSDRAVRDIKLIAAFLAVLDKSDKITVEHLRQAAVYGLAHRLEFQPDYQMRNMDDTVRDYLLKELGV